MTHFLVLPSILHVSLELEGGCPGARVGAMGPGSVLEGVLAMGVAGTSVLLLASGGVVENLDGTFRCPLKVQSWSMLSRFCLSLVKL